MNGILDKTLSARIKTRVQEELSAQVADQGKAPDEAMLKAMITSIIASLTDSLGSFSPRDVEEFTGEVVNDFLYLGPLQALLADDTVTEIAVNGPHRVYVERAGRMQR
ncbi:MAG: hypothetical protein RR757_03945, partial [Raoultibacter sp.]